MTNIRTYIDLIESQQNEGFLGGPQHTSPMFGRKNTDYVATEPSNAERFEELRRCREHPTAESYADYHNRFGRTYNTDPEHIQRNAQNERNRLMSRWNHWNAVGLLDQK